MLYHLTARPTEYADAYRSGIAEGVLGRVEVTTQAPQLLGEVKAVYRILGRTVILSIDGKDLIYHCVETNKRWVLNVGDMFGAAVAADILE